MNPNLYGYNDCVLSEKVNLFDIELDFKELLIKV